MCYIDTANGSIAALSTDNDVLKYISLQLWTNVIYNGLLSYS